MMAQIEMSPAFLVSSRDYGEADRILTFFTREAGKVSGIARAAKKSRKRFGAALDWFHLVKLHYRVGHGDLYQLNNVDLVWRSQNIASNLECYAAASYFLELVRELTEIHHPDYRLFDLLHAVLMRLEELAANGKHQNAMHDLIHYFELQLLDLIGLKPSFQFCTMCTAQEGTPMINLSNGDLRCHSCQHIPAFPYQERFNLNTSTLKTMKAALKYEAANLADLPRFGAIEHREASRFIHDFIRFHVHKELRTRTFLAQVGSVPANS